MKFNTQKSQRTTWFVANKIHPGMTNNLRKNPSFLLAMGCVFAVGAYLRLNTLSSQILLDDEWHSINEVIGKNYTDVLTQFNPHDNFSLPFAIYNLALYHTFGWSEFTLRLPVILAGLLSLIFLPLLVKKTFNERVSLMFSCFLAIAPFLIFYSRYARAYGFVMLLCFSALILFYQWLTTGKLRYAVGFVFADIFAIYAHLFSLVAVFTPLVTVIGFELVNRFKVHSSACQQIVVPFKALLIMALILILLLLPIMIPVLLESTKLPWQMGKLTLDGVITATTLMSGTVNCPLTILFSLLCIIGQKLLFRHNPLLGWIFLSTICAYIVVLLVSRPLGLDTGAVLLRYTIVVVPMALTMVALAIDQFLMRVRNIKRIHRSIPILMVAGFIGCLYAAGPLSALHVLPNNFTNHSAFQGSYKHQMWERSDANTVYPAFSVKQDQISPFYRWLGGQSNIEAVIEYPFDICDYNDLFYYYQHFHKKRVIAGYCTDPMLLGYRIAPSPDQGKSPFSIGMLSTDAILSRVADPTKLTFHNMVDVSDAAALLRSQADIIVLHKYIMALKIMPNGVDATAAYGSIQVYYRSVELLKVRFKEIFGPPAYEDGQIICFYVKQPKPGENGPAH
jgi:uncharacterized membrane protein